MSDAIFRFNNREALSGLTGIVDHQNAVIHGASLITAGVEAEGHALHVDDITVDQLYSLACEMGQVPVTLDHGGGITSINGYFDNFRKDGNKLRGDWHLLKTHNETVTMLERAERQPKTFGISVAFKGPKEGVLYMGKKCARAKKLLSADCVTRPAANADGMFGAKDEPVVDTRKKDMDAQNLQNEPTMADLMQAIQQQNQQIAALTNFQNQVTEYLSNQSQQNQAPVDPSEAYDVDLLTRLYNASDEQLAEAGYTRAEVDAAVSDFNAAVDAFNGSQGDTREVADSQRVSQDQGGGEAFAGAGAGQGASQGGGEGVAMSAIRQELLELKAAYNRDKRLQAEAESQIEFSEVQGKIALLAQQRNQLVEFADRLIARCEALELANRTGSAPVGASASSGTRLFSAKDGEVHEFQHLVKQHKEQTKCSDGEALQFVSRENPSLHEDWLRSLSK